LDFYCQVIENKLLAIAFKSAFLSLAYFLIIYRLKIAMELQEIVFGFFRKKEL